MEGDSCGCVLYFAFYPCGHQASTWRYCTKAKVKNFFRRGSRKACKSYVPREVTPDLEDTCGSTCLAQPYQCTHCGSPKEIGWRCSRCQYFRTSETPVWDSCTCPKHDCYELGVGKKGETMCARCRGGACVPRTARSSRLRSRKIPILNWKCHACDRKQSTPANAMRCGGRLGVGGLLSAAPGYVSGVISPVRIPEGGKWEKIVYIQELRRGHIEVWDILQWC
ncbi:hypothetical protein F4804DRAFT_353701 [Jackrogersella minutella]|nr:hypothetical protein F4804DRAFT_353701 [Jackrogersella minutella]